VEDFTRILVYQKARIFSREIFVVTRRFPYAFRKLATQLDDAAESIGSNIAEGCGRKNRDHGNAALIRYLHMSFGSACETQHRIGGAHDRELMTDEEYDHLISSAVEIKRMLSKFIRSLGDGDRGRLTS
jgi:four helix bundle protein